MIQILQLKETMSLISATITRERFFGQFRILPGNARALNRL
jgi:hypothetical protein